MAENLRQLPSPDRRRKLNSHNSGSKASKARYHGLSKASWYFNIGCQSASSRSHAPAWERNFLPLPRRPPTPTASPISTAKPDRVPSAAERPDAHSHAERGNEEPRMARASLTLRVGVPCTSSLEANVLYPMVVGIQNVNIAAAVSHQSPGIVHLTRSATVRPPATERISVQRELLDPVVSKLAH